MRGEYVFEKWQRWDENNLQYGVIKFALLTFYLY